MRRSNLLLALVAANVIVALAPVAPAVELPYTGSDLRLWLRGDGTFDLASNDRVDTWYDYTGYGGNTVADNGTGVASFKPLWVDNSLGGRPVVQFDSSKREIDGTAALSGGNDARTIIIVATNTSTGDQNKVLFDPNGQGSGSTLFRVTPELGVRFGNGNSLYSTALGSTASIVIAQLPAVGTIGDTLMYFNSSTALPSASQSNPGNAVATGTAGYLIGGTTDYQGSVAEVLAFDAQLSATELDAIGAYLTQKYALSTGFASAPTQVFYDGQSIVDSDLTRDGNWDTSLRPTASQDAYLGGGLSATLDLPGAVANNFYVGHNESTQPGEGTLTIDDPGATLNAKILHIGTAGEDGTVYFKRGTIALTGDNTDQSLQVGETSGSIGTLIMGTIGANDADTVLDYGSHRFEVSRNGGATGNFTLNSGTVNGKQNFIVTQGGGTANVNIHGGSFYTTTDMNFNNGTGTYYQDGGTVSVQNLNQANVASAVSSITVDGGTLTIRGNLIERSGTSTINLGGTGVLELIGNSTTRDTQNFNQSGSSVFRLALIDASGVSAPLNVQIAGTFAGSPTIELQNMIPATTATILDWVDGTDVWDDDPTGKWTGNQLPGNANNTIAAGTHMTVITSASNLTGAIALSSGSAGWTINLPDSKTVEMVNSAAVGGPVTARISGATSIVTRSSDLHVAAESVADAAGLILENGAQLTLSGSNNLTIGGAAQGTIDHNGGTLIVGGDLLFGGSFGSQGGVYNLNGGFLTVGGDIVEGDSGAPDANVNSAQLQINGGTLSVAGDISVQRFSLAEVASSNGAGYTIPNGQTVYSSGTSSIGSQGTNASLVVGGAWVSDGTAFVAEQTGSSATLTLNPGGSVTTNNTFDVAAADGATGTVLLNGGTFHANKGWSQAAGATGNAMLTVEDGAVLNVSGGNFETAENGTGKVVWHGGTLNQTTSNVIVGQNADSDATFEMYGGTLNITNQLRITNKPDIAGRFYVYGGTANVGTVLDTLNTAGSTTSGKATTALIVVDDTHAGSTGDAILNVGGDLVLGNTNLDGTTQMDLIHGTVTVDGNLKLSTGGSKPSTTFNLTDGTLDMTGGDVIFGAGPAAFNFTGGLLKNVGTFGATLNQQGGTLAPGASPGVTTINGDYIVQNGGILQIEFDSPTAGGFDQLVVNGEVNLQDAQLDVIVGYTPIYGEQVVIVDNDVVDPVLGLFSDANTSLVLGEGATFFAGDSLLTISYRGGDGNDIVLTAVPEPSTTVALAGIAAMGLLGYLRRRRRR